LRRAKALQNEHGTASYNLAVGPPRIDFLQPWENSGPGQANACLSELTRELSLGHPLYAVELKALGHSRAADDVLFATDDGRVVEVHLTWSQRAERPPWPTHRFYSTVDEWIEQVMLSEHDGM
jgi:hypothetical protein